MLARSYSVIGNIRRHRIIPNDTAKHWYYNKCELPIVKTLSEHVAVPQGAVAGFTTGAPRCGWWSLSLAAATSRTRPAARAARRLTRLAHVPRGL